MKLQTTPNQLNNISHYDEISLTIEQQKYDQSILITGNNIIVLNKKITNLNSLTSEQLSLNKNIDLLLIGGHKITPLHMPHILQKELSKLKISLELMSLGAACRTYNILRSEDRDVACLIMF